MIVIDNTFVTEHTGLIKSLIHQRTQSHPLTREEAVDLFTDVVVKCMVNARYYDGTYAVGTFIGLQVRSALAELLLKKSKHRTSDALSFSTPLMPEHDAPIEEPEDDTETMEYFQRKLAPYLITLSPNEQAVITNHVWSRLGTNEIAEKLGLNATSVSVIKKRAISKIRSYLQKGRQINKKVEVDVDVPLESAIMQLPDAQYHAYRLHHWKGWSINRVAAIMGRSMLQVVALIDDAKASIAQEYGYRA